jgi:hypothetical protein
MVVVVVVVVAVPSFLPSLYFTFFLDFVNAGEGVHDSSR